MGRKKCFLRRGFSCAPAGAFISVRLEPTARAVGYWRTLLRSLGCRLTDYLRRRNGSSEAPPRAAKASVPGSGRADFNQIIAGIQQAQGLWKIRGKNLAQGGFRSVAAGQPDDFWRAAVALQ